MKSPSQHLLRERAAQVITVGTSERHAVTGQHADTPVWRLDPLHTHAAVAQDAARSFVVLWLLVFFALGLCVIIGSVFWLVQLLVA